MLQVLSSEKKQIEKDSHIKRKKIAVFDCETDPFLFGRKPEPFLIGYYDEKQYRSFRKVADFVEFIKEQDVICYAHNGGKFDFLFLVPFFEPDTKIFLINERIGSFKLGKCEFRDSYLILPIPLSAYKKDIIDYKIMERGVREEEENMKLISDYLKNDCIYLFELVKAFRKKYGTRLTIASTAMHQWQRISGKKAPHTKESQFIFFKDWYFGGRVQVFKPGIFIQEDQKELIQQAKKDKQKFQLIKKPIRGWDINRAYSAAMKQAWFPYGSVQRQLDRLPDDPAELGRCFLEIEAHGLGAYPLPGIRGKEAREAFFKEYGFMPDNLSFPRDGQRYVFKITGWEYLAAVATKTAGKPKILAIYSFDEKINFKEFVDEFYDPTIPRDNPEYHFKKLIGNSLYGKFGQDCREFKDFYLVEQTRILEKEVEFKGVFSDFVGRWALIGSPQPEEKRKFYNVAISASITGWVRAFLWNSICESTEVFYCDTDCIHAIQSKVKVGNELGLWKEEFQAIEGAYAGKKLYALRKQDGSFKIASKGFRGNGPDIFKIANGEEITYRQDAPSMSLKGIKFQERTIRMTI